MVFNWFDIAIFIIVVVTLIKGYSSGFVVQLASISGIVLGAIFSGKLSAIVVPAIIQYLGVSPHVIGSLSYVIAFIIIFLGFFLLGKLLTSFLKAIQLNFLNRLAGAIFCTGKWLLLLGIVLITVAEMDQGKRIIKEDTRDNTISYPLINEGVSFLVPYLDFRWIDKIHL